jgi:hypothetical protein
VLIRQFVLIKSPRFIEAQRVACIESIPRGERFISRLPNSQSKVSHVERDGVLPKRLKETSCQVPCTSQLR